MSGGDMPDSLDRRTVHRVNDVVLWLEQESSVHIKAVTPQNDPVELSPAEARRLGELLIRLAEEADGSWSPLIDLLIGARGRTAEAGRCHTTVGVEDVQPRHQLVGAAASPDLPPQLAGRTGKHLDRVGVDSATGPRPRRLTFWGVWLALLSLTVAFAALTLVDAIINPTSGG
jgi:hypothetical protein